MVEARNHHVRFGQHCGFADPKYFAKLFRREFGCLPSEYQAR